MSFVLVDMDGVMVDWSNQFESDLATHYPELVFEEMREFTTPTHLPQSHQDAINAVKYRSGFYREMKPIEGAIENFLDLAEVHEVWFCSSPEVYNESCESDKKMWIRQWLGDEWAKRLILTRDKTLVRGDYLIDDRPDVTGAMIPEWTHILFSQPYNDHVIDRPRLNKWEDWRLLFEEVTA